MGASGKYFEFDHKIGWAHLISVLALLLSVVSLWTASQRAGARVVISRESSVGGPFLDEKKGRWRLFGYERVILSNVGGGSITLIGLRLPKNPPFPGLLAAFVKGGRPQEVKTEVLLIDDFLEDLKKNPKVISE